MLLFSYDLDRDKFLGVEDLKKMMKKIKSTLVEPSSVEDMISEVDEDKDGKLSLREVTCHRNLTLLAFCCQYCVVF